jgi:hypothetical protein
MQLSVEKCREQEALQLAKAQTEPLESRRNIAQRAAKAWAAAALASEVRASRLGQLDKADAAIALEFARESD